MRHEPKSYTAPTAGNGRVNPNDASAVPFQTNREKAVAFRRLSRIFANADRTERKANNLLARAHMLANQAATSAGIFAERTRNGRDY